MYFCRRLYRAAFEDVDSTDVPPLIRAIYIVVFDSVDSVDTRTSFPCENFAHGLQNMSHGNAGV